MNIIAGDISSKTNPVLEMGQVLVLELMSPAS